MGVGRPKSREGSLRSEVWGVGCCWCWSLSVTSGRPETFGLFSAGSSAESTVSGVDLLRRVGDEVRGLACVSPCPTAGCGASPLWDMYSQTKLRFVQVLQGLSPLH